jgi:hypothetical protein
MQHLRVRVEDSIPKVDRDVAVGENIEFQRKWWRFERVIWIFFLCVLVCDLLGLFGRGWLAKSKRSSSDLALTVDYERVERAGTPSIMTLHFSPAAVRDGSIRLFLSESVIKGLGAQRISPQPIISTLSEGGTKYTLSAGSAPAVAEIHLQPSFPGRYEIRIQMPGSDPVEATVFVMP